MNESKKRKWSTPTVSVQLFVPNEYVAACHDTANYYANVTCAMPGTHSDSVGDYHGRSNEIYKDTLGMWHGLCAYASSTMEVVNGSGYETKNGTVSSKRTISNLEIGSSCSYNTGGLSFKIGSAPDELSSGYYKATWTSYDGENETGSYNHYGIAQITKVVTQGVKS